MTGQASATIREEITTGLRAGKTLHIVRKDDPFGPVALEMHYEGLVTLEVVQLDEQSSEMRVRATDLLLQGTGINN